MTWPPDWAPALTDWPMPCDDCGIDTGEAREFYMVHAELWQQAGGGDTGSYLCVGCLEKRLGRELEPADFTDAPCNHHVEPDEQSDRLRSRIGQPITRVTIEPGSAHFPEGAKLDVWTDDP